MCLDPRGFRVFLGKGPWIPASLVAQSCFTQLNVISDNFGSRCFLKLQTSDQRFLSFVRNTRNSSSCLLSCCWEKRITLFLSINFTYIFRSVILAIVFQSNIFLTMIKIPQYFAWVDGSLSL